MVHNFHLWNGISSCVQFYTSVQYSFENVLIASGCTSVYCLWQFCCTLTIVSEVTQTHQGCGWLIYCEYFFSFSKAVPHPLPHLFQPLHHLWFKAVKFFNWFLVLLSISDDSYKPKSKENCTCSKWQEILYLNCGRFISKHNFWIIYER